MGESPGEEEEKLRGVKAHGKGCLTQASLPPPEPEPTILRDRQQAQQPQTLNWGNLSQEEGRRSWSVYSLPQAWARAAASLPWDPPSSHLPVDVLFDEADALPDIKPFQKGCQENVVMRAEPGPGPASQLSCLPRSPTWPLTPSACPPQEAQKPAANAHQPSSRSSPTLKLGIFRN